MARVTKINVGGTNYDIAHEGVLKNSGFEVVTSLPTTGLFEGREVVYQGKKYVYSSGWKEEITSNTMYEANLRWGGRNISNGFSPVDAAMVGELSANLMAFPNPAGITVEYSRDGGVTWLDYEATDKQKIEVFTKGPNYYWICGKPELDGSVANVNFRLRVTLDTFVCGVYSFVNKVIVGVYTFGSSNCWLTILAKKKKYSDIDTAYETIVDKAIVNGWHGYNVVNFSPFLTWDGSNDAKRLEFPDKIRFILGYDSIESGYESYKGLALSSLFLYGNGRYKVPSSLARTNHLYNYDYLQNAIFPAMVMSNEVINFNVNNIEPTQTGNVTKTSTWLWQYLVQGVNWLKANNVRLSAYNTKVAALEQADTDNNASIQSVSTDLTELSNGLAAVATSGSYNDLIDKPTFSGSYNDLTDKPTLFSGSYDDLTNKPTLAAVATSGSYDDLLNKPDLVFSNIGGNVATAQITDGSITNAKLANSSMTLNGIICELGGTKTLPCIISFDGTLYKVRIYQNWLQIYHAGTWVNKYYLLSSQPTECRYITDLSDPSWYDESVTEYELDNSATEQLLRANSSVNLANWLEAIDAQQITFNSSLILSKDFNKGALDNIISNLKGKGYSVFVENDIDTILNSGNDWVMSIKIKRFNDTYKAIIECYVAR